MRRCSRCLQKLKLDADGLPLTPAWSLREHIAAQPSTSLSREKLLHLHKLSALQPPATPEKESKLKAELEDLIQLVESVRQFPQKVDLSMEFPDGRIWPEGEGIQLEEVPKAEGQGSFVDLASKALGRYYVVEALRPK
jgi:Asp-tRNA(Asn)/Glu-tRNA(Gln) amidotransferase C subunit